MDLTDFFGSALSADELPFFDDDDIHTSLCGTYKIYCDGGHLIGSRVLRKRGARPSLMVPAEYQEACKALDRSLFGEKATSRDDFDVMSEAWAYGVSAVEFDRLWDIAKERGYPWHKFPGEVAEDTIINFVAHGLSMAYPDFPYIEEYIEAMLCIRFPGPDDPWEYVERLFDNGGCQDVKFPGDDPILRAAQCGLTTGVFDRVWREAFVENGLRDRGASKALTAYLVDVLSKGFPDCPCVSDFVAVMVKRKFNNIVHRKKRFRRKAYLNDWNYFVTLTFDDKKHNADSFRKKLRRALSNFHTRRGWRYMGVFETAPETGRLHFHGLMYIPDGEMVGRLDEIEDYSTAKHCMQTHVENSFFAKKFGRSDFVELNAVAMRYGQTVDYILKYIAKTGERIVYSRGIPTEVCKALTRDDIITEMCDFAGKFLLFDDVLDSERWKCRPLLSLALPNKGYSPPIVA